MTTMAEFFALELLDDGIERMWNLLAAAETEAQWQADCRRRSEEAHGRALAVVAVQREALRFYADRHNYSPPAVLLDLGERARKALDAEGVTERGDTSSGRRQKDEWAPRSVTSPVDTARRAEYDHEGQADTAPRGYVEHGPGGPQAVYHAETPDAYLEHGDR